MPLESRLCWSNRAPFRPISGRAARSWESRPRKRPRPTSAQFAHALDHRKASQSRPDRGREAHRQDRARSQPQASLPGGPRRETQTGVEAHPTLEVARETSREFPEDRRKILMGVTALWTAAHYRIPMLMVVANNRSFYNDEVHQERVARIRKRPIEN